MDLAERRGLETEVYQPAEDSDLLAAAAIDDVEEAMEVPEPQVITKAFDDSAVLLGVRFWIDKPSARKRAVARSVAIGSIKRTFEDAGIKIPYPQRELSGRAETGGFRVANEASNRARDGSRGGEDEASRDDEEGKRTTTAAEGAPKPGSEDD